MVATVATETHTRPRWPCCRLRHHYNCCRFTSSDYKGRDNVTSVESKSRGRDSKRLFGRHLVQLAVADAELDDLLPDGFDLEIVQAPVIDADVLIPESEAVELGLRLGLARRRL